jgi:hypothetical protein
MGGGGDWLSRTQEKEKKIRHEKKFKKMKEKKCEEKAKEKLLLSLQTL